MPMAKCSNPQQGLLLPLYELHLLSPDETEQFELHILECSFCTRSLGDSQEVIELLRSDPQLKLVVHELASANSSLSSRITSAWWPDLPLLFRPAAAIVLIALGAASIALLQNDDDVVLAPNQTKAVAPDSIPAASDRKSTRTTTVPTAVPVQLISLKSLRSGTRKYAAIDGEPLVIRFATDLALAGNPLRVQVFDPQSRMLLDDNALLFDEQTCGQFLLPATSVFSGEYQIIISTPGDSTRESADDIRFLLEVAAIDTSHEADSSR